ncbi:MAG TPA: alpha-xylosidase [Azospirillaceae bacterium]|nr:alpha-xylosidase [Azospirillaceae bacterium]
MSTIETVVDHWPSPNWGRIPPVTVTGPARQEGPGRVLLPTSAGNLHVSLYPFGVRLRSAPRAVGGYGMLNAEPAELPVTLRAGEGETVVEGGGLRLAIGHEPFGFELSRGGAPVQRSPSDGHFVRRFRLPPLARIGRGWFVSLDLASGEPVYGLGEKWGRLDHRGQIVRSRNEDALGVNAERSYKNTPFAWSPEGWGAFVHTPSPVTHAVGFAPWSQRAYGILVEDEALDLFLFAGRDGAEIIGHYTALTGRAPVPPLWSLGVILSKAYYKTPEEVLEVAAEVRRRGMPCDTITFDGRAWQDTDTRFTFEWDPKRFSDPGAVIAKLKEMDFRVCVWEYPLVSVNNPWFAEMAAKGWLLKDRRTGEAYRYAWDLEPFGAVLTPLPESGLVDFTHPDAYAFWRDCHKPLFELGVDMIKADFGEQVEDDMQASNGETGHALHNVYAHLYNRCVYEAAERYCRSGPFLFSRASWIGAQRYPAQWGGDPQADWEGMAGNLRGGLSWGLSGAPYYATDVGGFYRDQRDAALYVRWAQAAVFSAHMRLHGIGPREPWSYGAEADAAVTAALELRYRLIPYLRRAMEAAHATGLPVQRAMALAFPRERAAWAFEDQFMLGEDMLVAPCLRPDGKVEVYLPEGRWRRFPSAEAYGGGRCHRLTLALSEMAVFVREGTEIPLGPAVKHTGELGGEPVVAEVWRAG